MQCADCGKLRHEGECDVPTCGGCDWPLEPGQDRYCDACALELAEIDADMAQRRLMDLKERNTHGRA